MYSYAAMKANKPTEDKTTNKDTTKVKAETKIKATKQRGEKNDEGTERADSTITKG